MRKRADAVSAPQRPRCRSPRRRIGRAIRTTPKSAGLKRLEASEAPKGVDQRIHMEEEGTVHQGVVDVTLPGGKQPGEVGVQALVVVQSARPEIPEARQHPSQQDQHVETRFEGESDGRRDPGRCHGRLREYVGVAVVAHRQSPAAVAVSGDVARRERGLIVTPGISIVPQHSLGRRYRLSHAGVPRSDERAPWASGAPGEYTTHTERGSGEPVSQLLYSPGVAYS